MGHVLYRPFVDSVRVFTKHPLSRAGNIGQDDGEVVCQRGEVGGIVVGYYHIARSPFDEVFRQDGDAAVGYFASGRVNINVRIPGIDR